MFRADIISTDIGIYKMQSGMYLKILNYVHVDVGINRAIPLRVMDIRQRGQLYGGS